MFRKVLRQVFTESRPRWSGSPAYGRSPDSGSGRAPGDRCELRRFPTPAGPSRGLPPRGGNAAPCPPPDSLDETLSALASPPIPSVHRTNCIENVNSLLEQLTHNVRRWTNSSQRHRWIATVLLDIEPRLRRVKGYRHLPTLRRALQAELGIQQLAMTG